VTKINVCSECSIIRNTGVAYVDSAVTAHEKAQPSHHVDLDVTGWNNSTKKVIP